MSARETPRDQAEAWLRLAQEDLLSARTLLEHQSEVLRNAAFLAQQAAEKALKAVFVAYDVPVPKVHDLMTLVKSLPAESTDLDPEALAELNPWAVAGRYAVGRPPLDRESAHQLLALAESVIATCSALVEDAPPPADAPGQT